MNVELVAQMFKNYQSNALFHLEGLLPSLNIRSEPAWWNVSNNFFYSYREFEGAFLSMLWSYRRFEFG